MSVGIPVKYPEIRDNVVMVTMRYEETVIMDDILSAFLQALPSIQEHNPEYPVQAAVPVVTNLRAKFSMCAMSLEAKYQSDKGM